MQGKEKKDRKATWQGFEGEYGTDYTVYCRGNRVQLVAKTLEADGNEDVREVEMSLDDLKVFLSIAQDLLRASGGDVLRGIGITRE